MKNKKGITLIELIIAMAVLSIVLAAAFSIFIFGNKTYSYGTTQYDIQANLRIAKEYVTDQLKYASYILVTNDSTAIPAQSSMDAYENYIYYDDTTHSIKHLNRFFIKSFNISLPDKPDSDGSIAFESADPYNTLYLKVYAKEGRQQYYIDNTIDLLNIHLSDKTAGKVDGTISGALISGGIIKFLSPSDYLARLLKPQPAIVNVDDVNKELTLNFTYDPLGTPVELHVNSVTLLDQTGITGALAALGSPNTTAVFSWSDHLPDARVFIQVTFSDSMVADDTYIYILEYDAGAGIWKPR